MARAVSDLIVLPGAAGADEVGRGALAGPVVCAAVLLPPGFDTKGLDDSKMLTESQRRTQADRVLAGALCAVEFVDAEEIDRLNILRASLAGMARAFLRLSPQPERLLVDGRDLPSLPGVAVEAHIKGDGKFAAIAAASIIAKVARDDWMAAQDAAYPGYGFASHVGYGSPSHLEAIRALGPCPLHRRSFDPVRTMLSQGNLDFG
jgi:ribonuclease HII